MRAANAATRPARPPTHRLAAPHSAAIAALALTAAVAAAVAAAGNKRGKSSLRQRNVSQ